MKLMEVKAPIPEISISTPSLTPQVTLGPFPCSLSPCQRP